MANFEKRTRDTARKKVLSALAIVATSVSVSAQGNIDFINRNIRTVADPTVLYNVPLYVPGGRATGTGAGNLSGGVTIGLFLAEASDDATPLFSTTLRTGTAAQFFVIPATGPTATIPGVPAGSTANLMVRAWQGTSFINAKASSSLVWDEWRFTSQPLGGTPPGGGAPIPTPGMTGWGPENGIGFEFLTPGVNMPEPSTVGLSILAAGVVTLARRHK